MTPKERKSTPGRNVPGLRAAFHEALEKTTTDTELVEKMIASGALQTALQVGTYSTEEAAQALGIGIKSVRTLATKSAIFPTPAVKERRYAINDIHVYADTRRKRTPPNKPQENSEESTTE